MGKRREGIALTDARHSSPRSSGGRIGETLRAGAPPAALRPSRATAASARQLFLRLAAPARRRNDQRQARELQERAILPALQCEAGEDHPQGRFASYVMQCRVVKGLVWLSRLYLRAAR